MSIRAEVTNFSVVKAAKERVVWRFSREVKRAVFDPFVVPVDKTALVKFSQLLFKYFTAGISY